MKSNAFLLICLLFGLSSCSNQEQPLNVIIIYADDLGYGDLSCFGHPTIKTPGLDKMATEGQKWTQFYVASPVCTPSRAALLTGRYPIRNGMTSAKRAVLFPNSTGGLPQSEITIAEVLKQKNYATAAIGKWHLGHLPAFLPTQHGFDYYYGIPYSNDMDYIQQDIRLMEAADDPNFLSDYRAYNVPLMENEKIIERPADQNTITRRYTEKAIDFIKTHTEKPFFLYLAHNLPHIPLFAHPDRVGQSSQGLYGDVIEEIDWSVTQILNTLTESGLHNKTLVVFSSDNGPWLAFRTHGGSAGPLRAGKGTTFEGGQRVPTIFWGPSVVQPGIIHEMGSTLDLINTIASLTGTTLPEDRKMDGYDLSAVLKDPSQKSPRTTFHYWSNSAELFAVRSGKWKLHLKQSKPVFYWRPPDSLVQPELFDLESDIAEKYDLSEQNPELIQQLQALAKVHQADITNPLDDNLSSVTNQE